MFSLAFSQQCKYIISMCALDCFCSPGHCFLGGCAVSFVLLRQVLCCLLPAGLPDFTAHACTVCTSALCLSPRIASLFKQLDVCVCMVSLPSACSLKAVQKKWMGVDCCLQIKPQICSGEAVGKQTTGSRAWPG